MVGPATIGLALLAPKGRLDPPLFPGPIVSRSQWAGG